MVKRILAVLATATAVSTVAVTASAAQSESRMPGAWPYIKSGSSTACATCWGLLSNPGSSAQNWNWGASPAVALARPDGVPGKCVTCWE